jgi:MFS family permease
MIGRNYTFLITIPIIGLSTFLVSLLPSSDTISWIAPVILIALRMLKRLALGGAYGSAAVYVAEHAPADRRDIFAEDKAA